MTSADGLFDRASCSDNCSIAAFAASAPIFTRVSVNFSRAWSSSLYLVTISAMSFAFGGNPTNVPCCICLMADMT